MSITMHVVSRKHFYKFWSICFRMIAYMFFCTCTGMTSRMLVCQNVWYINIALYPFIDGRHICVTFRKASRSRLNTGVSLARASYFDDGAVRAVKETFGASRAMNSTKRKKCQYSLTIAIRESMNEYVVR